jgi:sulfur carrier protein
VTPSDNPPDPGHGGTTPEVTGSGSGGTGSGGTGRGTIVNGDTWQGAPGATVTDAVASWCPSQRGVAVAVNGTVVPRSRWDATVLNPGDRVEIVTAAAGG